MVILIIALLMAFIVPQVLQGPAKARDVARTTHLNQIAVALESYLAAEGKLPQGTCLDPNSAIRTELEKGYLSASKFPEDPLKEHDNFGCIGSYHYEIITPTGSRDKTYKVGAKMESGKDYYVDGK